MSDYFKALDPIAKTQYLDKLQLFGLKEEDDPYLTSNDNKFVEDITTV